MKLLCAVLISSLLFALQVSAREIMVSASAPAAGDGSVTFPFRSIQSALNVAQPGDRILVAAGSYRESLRFPRSGRRSAPIILEGTGGATLIEGRGKSANVQIRDKRYITIKDCVFYKLKRGSTSVIYIEGRCSGIRLLDNDLENDTKHRGHAISVRGTKVIQDLTFKNNRIDKFTTRGGAAISVSGNVFNFRIADMVIGGNFHGGGIELLGGKGVAENAALDFPRNGILSRIEGFTRERASGSVNETIGIRMEGVRGILVSRCVLTNFGTGITIKPGANHGTTSEIVVRGCRVFFSRTSGILLDGRNGKLTQCLLENNNIAGSKGEENNSGQVVFRSAREIDFRRNIVETNRSSIPLLITDEACQQITSDSNRFRVPDRRKAALFTWEGIQYTSFAAYQLGSRQDSHSVLADPTIGD